jgi:hypothetical protein
MSLLTAAAKMFSSAGAKASADALYIGASNVSLHNRFYRIPEAELRFDGIPGLYTTSGIGQRKLY